NADVMHPFERAYSWHVAGALDSDAMDAAARVIEGRHDFAAFQSTGTDVATTTREGFASRIARDGCLVSYELTGTGVLRHMVRTIVGRLVEIGRGRRPAAWIADVLASRDRAHAGPTAPASALVLVAVDYGSALADEP